MDIYIDGECCPNPGKGRSVIVIEKRNNKPEILVKKIPGETTNNRAEYEAFMMAMNYVKNNIMDELKQKKVNVYTDSKLIFGHLTQNWKVNSNKEIVAEAKKMVNEIRNIGIETEIRWIPREKNIAGVMIENGEV